ncbi:hypothetical protein ROP_00550 [Rhodococcus opacus B4]|uniref:Uncharacterized protein n=1 Tax=Rhodococcus opacus (strain B4) TaxID=632772 RepID=C1AS53_RHOOB|nr:hypothetical protein ROP_00550 [Rhodococcus opacus B4]
MTAAGNGSLKIGNGGFLSIDTVGVAARQHCGTGMLLLTATAIRRRPRQDTDSCGGGADMVPAGHIEESIEAGVIATGALLGQDRRRGGQQLRVRRLRRMSSSGYCGGVGRHEGPFATSARTAGQVRSARGRGLASHC